MERAAIRSVDVDINHLDTMRDAVVQLYDDEMGRFLAINHATARVVFRS